MRAVELQSRPGRGPQGERHKRRPTRWPRSFPALLQLQAGACVRASGHPRVRMHLMRFRLLVAEAPTLKVRHPASD